jgi:hypothetical protein
LPVDALPYRAARNDSTQERACEKVLPMSIKSRVILVPTTKEFWTSANFRGIEIGARNAHDSTHFA